MDCAPYICSSSYPLVSWFRQGDSPIDKLHKTNRGKLSITYKHYIGPRQDDVKNFKIFTCLHVF